MSSISVMAFGREHPVQRLAVDGVVGRVPVHDACPRTGTILPAKARGTAKPRAFVKRAWSRDTAWMSAWRVSDQKPPSGSSARALQCSGAVGAQLVEQFERRPVSEQLGVPEIDLLVSRSFCRGRHAHVFSSFGSLRQTLAATTNYPMSRDIV